MARASTGSSGRGGGEAVAAILGGNVTVGGSGYSEFAEYITTGKMKAIAVTSGTRLKGVNVPTLKEQGINVEIGNWRGVYGAPGISEAQRKALTDLVLAALKTKSWAEALEKNSWTPAVLTGPAFDKFMDDDFASLLQAVDRDFGNLLALARNGFHAAFDFFNNALQVHRGTPHVMDSYQCCDATIDAPHHSSAFSGVNHDFNQQTSGSAQKFARLPICSLCRPSIRPLSPARASRHAPGAAPRSCRHRCPVLPRLASALLRHAPAAR